MTIQPRTSWKIILSLIPVFSFLYFLFPPPVLAQNSSPAPSTVTSKRITIWSEGTRLAGSLWVPKDTKDKLPAILLAHGWGGRRSSLDQTYAPKFTAAGFVVLSFDYRGWGDSDGKLVMVEPQPQADEQSEVTVRARLIREVIDPFDQIQDITNALAYLVGEATVDTEHIGLWGTSFGGGHAIYMGAHDPRIKAIVVQVGSQKPENARHWARFARSRAIAKARGDIDPIPQGIDQVDGLKGTPDIAKMIYYRPIDVAQKIRVPTLFIDVDEEELFDRTQHGYATYQIVKDNAPAEYKLYSGTHYSIYREHYEAASDLALEWFMKHLQQKR